MVTQCALVLMLQPTAIDYRMKSCRVPVVHGIGAPKVRVGRVWDRFRSFRNRDAVILTVLVMGFYSVWNLADMHVLQADPLASKGVRIGSTLLAFLLASRVFFSPGAGRAFLGKTVLPILLFFCVCLASTNVSKWPMLTAYKAFEVLVLIMLIAEGIRNQDSRPDSLLRWMIGVMVVQLCVVWIEGVVFPEVAWTTPSLSRSVNVHMLRGVCPVVNPNTVGFFGGTTLIYGICYLFGGGKWRLGYYVLISLGGVTILASYSRTSVCAALIAIFCVLLAFRKIGVIILLLTLLTLVMASGSVRTNIMRYADRGRDSTNLNSFTSGRLELWQESLEHFSSSFVLGKGYGAGFRAEQVGSNTNAHNSIVELFAGTGVLGVCAWLYMILNVGIQLMLVGRQQHKWFACERVAALALIVYLLIFSLGNIRGIYLDYSMLLLAGIVVYAEKAGKCSRVAQRNNSPWIRRRSLYCSDPRSLR